MEWLLCDGMSVLGTATVQRGDAVV